MNTNMKVSEQCIIAASKGNQVLGMILRNITYKDIFSIVPLYKAIVRQTSLIVYRHGVHISGKTYLLYANCV